MNKPCKLDQHLFHSPHLNDNVTLTTPANLAPSLVSYHIYDSPVKYLHIPEKINWV